MPTLVPPSEEPDSENAPTPPSADAPTLVDAPSPFPSPRPNPPKPPSARPPSPSPPARSAAPATQAFYNPQPILNEGVILASRYEIVRTLGEGGMGAVYQAKDLELNRMVALKVIRPELAKNPAIIDRFKQELLLSQRVTHRNVIRIYDLGEGDGVKFITMEFIEGQDLRSLIFERKKFPPDEAVGIMEQVCLALESAHRVDVIHRDLKPQNIMLDGSGRVLVMDFGLARTLEGDGMTQTGALVGTMEYMSPEQALAQDLDQRSDLFSAGLIFYELLTGQMPFRADSALASLIKRTQERAVPISSHDASFPENLSKIVSKCLERDPAARYQTAKDLLADLQAWEGKRTAGAVAFQSVKPWGQDIPWPKIGMGVAAVVLAMVGLLYRGKLFAPAPVKQAVVVPAASLAILPFHNASGDQSLDWLGPSIGDMLSTDVGQSARLRTVSPGRLHQILTDLRLSPSSVLDLATVKRVADFSNADHVVWGQYARFGDQIRIDATLQDLKNDTTTPLKVDVAGEKEIPAAIDRMAEAIRQKLALPDDVLKELKASSFQPTSQSVAALRAYNQGLSLERDGKHQEAQKQFEAATREDPAFALAFAKLAQTYSSLGYDNQAGQAAQAAVNLSQNLPQAEKYLVAAIRAKVTRNLPEAIRAYENLTKASPDNGDAQAALAGLYEDAGDYAKASRYQQAILEANPKDPAATLAIGRLAIKTGNPQASLDPLNRAQTLAIQLDNQEQKAAALHLIGVAYWRMNKPDEALRNYQQELAIWKQLGQQKGMAGALNEMAKVQVILGDNTQALSNFQQALTMRRDIGDKRGLADTLVDLGNFYADRGNQDQSVKMYKEALQIQRELADERLQAVLLNNIGAVYYDKAQYEDARTYYQQALQLREKLNAPRDIAETVHNLAETSVRMGQYEQASSQYLRALNLWRSLDDKRGAAIESYTLGTMFDYQGRYGSAINAKLDALNTFRDLKDKTYWLAEITGGYGESLILAGRGADAKPYLEEASRLARDLKNDGMTAQILLFQGDDAFYRGDFKAARSSYEQALQGATRSKEPDKILGAKIALVKASMQEGSAQQAVGNLRQLAQQAEEQALPNLAVDATISMAEAMLRAHDIAHAQSELERAILRSNNLGLKPLSARAEFLLGNAFRATGNDAEAQPHYKNALQILSEMRQDPGADKLVQRSDLKAISDESSRWSQGAKN
jgi:eukaryotic-like serine/threonine-protein kinase